MASQSVHFVNSTGNRLSGILDTPEDSPPEAFVLFAHCFSCTKDFTAAYHISKTLTQASLAVLRFDFAGLGASEGDFAETSLSSNVSDLVAAADFLQSKYDAPRLLIGHSLGGAAVVLAAGKIATSSAVVTIGAPSEAEHVIQHLDTTASKMDGKSGIPLRGKPLQVNPPFVQDVKQIRLSQAIASLKRALLVLHAPGDQVVPIEHAAKIFLAASHPKSFISLDTADHLLSDPKDALYAGGLIAAWSRRYIAGNQNRFEKSD
jgi:alpha/beta superfamily hydrolase